MIGGIMETQLQAGFSMEANADQKRADSLCGDAINNYKVVQSFGNDQMFVKKYEEIMQPIHKKQMK